MNKIYALIFLSLELSCITTNVIHRGTKEPVGTIRSNESLSYSRDKRSPPQSSLPGSSCLSYDEQLIHSYFTPEQIIHINDIFFSYFTPEQINSIIDIVYGTQQHHQNIVDPSHESIQIVQNPSRPSRSLSCIVDVLETTMGNTQTGMNHQQSSAVSAGSQSLNIQQWQQQPTPENLHYTVIEALRTKCARNLLSTEQLNAVIEVVPYAIPLNNGNQGAANANTLCQLNNQMYQPTNQQNSAPSAMGFSQQSNYNNQPIAGFSGMRTPQGNNNNRRNTPSASLDRADSHRNKRPYHKKTPLQKRILEQQFQLSSSLYKKRTLEIACLAKLTRKQVYNWFAERRCKN